MFDRSRLVSFPQSGLGAQLDGALLPPVHRPRLVLLRGVAAIDILRCFCCHSWLLMLLLLLLMPVPVPLAHPSRHWHVVCVTMWPFVMQAKITKLTAKKSTNFVDGEELLNSKNLRHRSKIVIGVQKIDAEVANSHFEFLYPNQMPENDHASRKSDRRQRSASLEPLENEWKQVGSSRQSNVEDGRATLPAGAENSLGLEQSVSIDDEASIERLYESAGSGVTQRGSMQGHGADDAASGSRRQSGRPSIGARSSPTFDDASTSSQWKDAEGATQQHHGQDHDQDQGGGREYYRSAPVHSSPASAEFSGSDYREQYEAKIDKLATELEDFREQSERDCKAVSVHTL